jgi:4-hydroxy-3-methylbut-2-en-1-yl diphosphate reductase
MRGAGGTIEEATGRRVLLAAPRGFCAGVERALAIIERLLDSPGPPIYVRHEIVHNQRVIEELEARGVRFVDSEDEVPPGSICVLAAHGVTPEVRDNATARKLTVVDATCPLVERVHLSARKAASEGRTILLIGHEDHDEVIGTLGEAPEATRVVASLTDIDALGLDTDEPIAFLTQTTLSVDDTATVVAGIRERFTDVTGPRRDDICYAVQNRQAAAKEIARDADVVLVAGARNSSNAARLVEVAAGQGPRAYLVPDASDLDAGWLDEATTVGLTAAASTPDSIVDELLTRLAELGFADVDERITLEERVRFPLPG